MIRLGLIQIIHHFLEMRRIRHEIRERKFQMEVLTMRLEVEDGIKAQLILSHLKAIKELEDRLEL